MERSYNEKFLYRAIALANNNIEQGTGGPFAAVIVKDGEIVAESVNTVTSDNDPTAHAEINAIREACKKLGDFQLSGCQLYASCEPCPMCLGAIYWARPDVVFFAASQEDAAFGGFDDAFIYDEIEKSQTERTIPFIRKPLPEGRKVFENWNRTEHKITY